MRVPSTSSSTRCVDSTNNVLKSSISSRSVEAASSCTSTVSTAYKQNHSSHSSAFTNGTQRTLLTTGSEYISPIFVLEINCRRFRNFLKYLLSICCALHRKVVSSSSL